MKQTTEIQMLGRKLAVKYSASALKQQAQLTEAVYLEMELQFGCLVKKAMVQKKVPPDHVTPLNDRLFLSFRPMMTNVCAPSSVDIHADESIKIIDIEKPERFAPDWVFIDYKAGAWTGDFGYERQKNKYFSATLS